MKNVLVVACAALSGVAAVSSAAVVTLGNPGGDTLGQSSFAAGTHWSDGLAPSAGNSYVVGISLLRTPPDANSYTFAGDSLSIDGPNGDFGYKGIGNTGVITINNLILNGGLIRQIQGVGDVFKLAGNINVIADSQIYAKQGLIEISAAISGSANITNPGSDGAGRTLSFTSPANTFTGNLINNGRFLLADDARMNFVIGANGVNNSVSGTGAENVFNGDFNLNLTGAGTTIGDSWTLVSASNKSFGSSFTVVGFAESNDIWRKSVSGLGNYTFTEATGVLTLVVPEPASLGALALSGILLRRRSR